MEMEAIKEDMIVVNLTERWPLIEKKNATDPKVGE